MIDVWVYREMLGVCLESHYVRCITASWHIPCGITDSHRNIQYLFYNIRHSLCIHANTTAGVVIWLTPLRSASQRVRWWDSASVCVGKLQLLEPGIAWLLIDDQSRLVLATVLDHHIGAGSGLKPNHRKSGCHGCQYTETIESGTVRWRSPNESELSG